MNKNDASHPNQDPLEGFSTQLQELAVQQAKKMINLTLYTKIRDDQPKAKTS